jgi:hypothetical protein
MSSALKVVTVIVIAVGIMYVIVNLPQDAVEYERLDIENLEPKQLSEEELRQKQWEEEAEQIRVRHLEKLEREHSFTELEAQTNQAIKELKEKQKQVELEFELKQKEHTEWMREYHKNNISYWTPAKVESLIRDYFPDAPIMVKVAQGESGLKHWHNDGRVVRGIVDKDDTGLMQINNRYWGEEAARLGLDYENSIVDNVRMARHIMDTQGITAWVYYTNVLAVR